MAIQLSNQAKTYLSIINREIDFEDLEKWYINNAMIGGSDVMRYLEINKNKYDTQ
jgi:hypothetical protein